MKDRQGVMRGKCNACNECEEYVSPVEGARCDYCNHTPTEHVRIITLGGCKKCGDECDEYVSAKKHSYTECQYCGCQATEHKGAEKLRKPMPKPQVPSGTVNDPGSSFTGQLMTSIPSTPGHGIPGMTVGLGTPPPYTSKCKFPGCSRPCFIENGKKHDFCGRTHAQKYKETFGSIALQPTTKSISSFPYTPVVSQSISGQSLPVLATLCSECGQKPANKGYSLCEECYKTS